jgi:hypothetical protein
MEGVLGLMVLHHCEGTPVRVFFCFWRGRSRRLRCRMIAGIWYGRVLATQAEAYRKFAARGPRSQTTVECPESSVCISSNARRAV